MEPPLPTTTIAISTFGTRVRHIAAAQLAPAERLQYLIVLQCPPGEDDGASLQKHLDSLRAGRTDIDMIILRSKGVAASRNAALEAVSSEILLFADDDAPRLPDGVAALRRWFADNPTAAMVRARAVDLRGHPRKRYPHDGTRMSIWNSGGIGTPELAVRVEPVRRAGVRFDEAFGAGKPDFVGDEYIFVTDCLRAGLTGCHVDVPVCVHAAESSGMRWTSSDAIDARAAVFDRVFGRSAILFRLAYTLARYNRFSGLAGAVRFVRGPGRAAARRRHTVSG